MAVNIFIFIAEQLFGDGSDRSRRVALRCESEVFTGLMCAFPMPFASGICGGWGVSSWG